MPNNERTEVSVVCNYDNRDEYGDPLYNDYSGNVVIPSYVTHDGKRYAVTAIGYDHDGAFYQCPQLISLTIPSSVKTLDGPAIRDCENLESVIVQSITPASIGYYTYPFGVLNAKLYVPAGSKDAYEADSKWKEGFKGGIEEYITFSYWNVKNLCLTNWDTNNDGILTMTEAAAVTNLGSVFEGNKDIVSFNELKYFTGVTTISGFDGCSGLTSVTIPNSVTTIGSCAFRGCSKLTTVSIPNTVTTIDDHAFYDCNSMTDVNIPTTVSYIGMSAFTRQNCPILNISISDLVSWNNIRFSEYWGSNYHLVLNGKEIKDLVIPEGITKIGDWAFSYCSGLTSVTFPNSVTSIGEGSFYGSSLTVFRDL